MASFAGARAGAAIGSAAATMVGSRAPSAAATGAGATASARGAKGPLSPTDYVRAVLAASKTPLRPNMLWAVVEGSAGPSRNHFRKAVLKGMLRRGEVSEEVLWGALVWVGGCSVGAERSGEPGWRKGGERERGSEQGRQSRCASAAGVNGWLPDQGS